VVTVTREWTITIPAPCDWLTANVERHKYQRAQLVRQWRSATWAACTKAKLPTGVTPVDIHAVVRYAGRQAPVRDRLNLAPTVKAIVDGLTPKKTTVRDGKTFHALGYGFLPDDSDKHVRATTWELERLTGVASTMGAALWGEVVLTIREAS
jgi:hypothetical protein